jgi:hypothetical protein
VTFVPTFLGYDENTGQPCFRTLPSPGLSEQEIASALRLRGRDTYRLTVAWSDAAREDVDYSRDVMTREYDIAAMYQSTCESGVA